MPNWLIVYLVVCLMILPTFGTIAVKRKGFAFIRRRQAEEFIRLFKEQYKKTDRLFWICPEAKGLLILLAFIAWSDVLIDEALT